MPIRRWGVAIRFCCVDRDSGEVFIPPPRKMQRPEFEMGLKALSYFLLASLLFAVGLGFGIWQRRIDAASALEIAAIMKPACRHPDSGERRDIIVAP